MKTEKTPIQITQTAEDWLFIVASLGALLPMMDTDNFKRMKKISDDIKKEVLT